MNPTRSDPLWTKKSSGSEPSVVVEQSNHPYAVQGGDPIIRVLFAAISSLIEPKLVDSEIEGPVENSCPTIRTRD